MKVLLILMLMTSLAHANTCRRLIDCVSEASALTGIKYLHPENFFTPKDEMNEVVVFDKKTADTVLSEALAMFDYMRVPTKVNKVWQIIPGKDLKNHSDVPTFQASKTKTPTLPKNQDPIQLVYTVQPGADLKLMQKNIQAFLTKFGRVVSAGTIITVIDRASIVAKLVPLMQASDVKKEK